MKRRQFIKNSAFLSAAAAFSPSLLTACKSEKPITQFDLLSLSGGNIQQARGNVSYYTNNGGTVGLLETKDGFVVIDAQFPDSIQPLLNGISGRQGKEIISLCNTHHHGDHTAGNIKFKGKTEKIIAQRQVPDYQKARAADSDTLDQQLYPNIIFDDSYTIDLGNQKIQAYHFGAAHTYGDAIFHFEHENVVHLGDLVFNNTVPVFRVKDGANATQWPEVLAKVLDKFDDDTLFIFGHANSPSHVTGSKDALNSMKSYMEAATEFIQDQIEEGITLEELEKTYLAIPGHEDRKTLWDAHWNEFLTNMYQGLQG